VKSIALFALLLVPSADRHDRAVDALVKGSAAIAGENSESLAAAGRSLRASGARPVDGADLAQQWTTGSDARPLRGRALGSAYRRATLEGGSRIAVEQIFLAGKKARVSLVPARPSRLRFSISNGSNDPLCEHPVEAAPVSCSWLPTWTERYRIEIENRSAEPVPLYLVID